MKEIPTKIEFDEFQEDYYNEIKLNNTKYIHYKNGSTDEILNTLHTDFQYVTVDLKDFLLERNFIFINEIKTSLKLNYNYYNPILNLIINYTIHLNADDDYKYSIHSFFYYYQKNKEGVLSFIKELEELKLPARTPIPLRYINFYQIVKVDFNLQPLDWIRI